MRGTGARDFAVVVYDGGWPARPNIPGPVRWVGDSSAPPQLVAGLDQAPDSAPAVPPVYPGDIANLVEHYIGDNATDSGADTPMLTWPSEISGSVTINSAPTMRHGALNGHKVADFTANRLTTPAFMGGAGPYRAVTVMVVGKFDSTANSNVVTQDVGGFGGDLLLGVNANNDIGGLSWPTELSSVVHASGTARGAATGAAVDLTGYHCWLFTFDGTGDRATIREDGVTVLDDVFPAGSDEITDRAWSIGCNFAGSVLTRSFDGKVADLAWWTRGLTEQELSDMHTYSSILYGTP